MPCPLLADSITLELEGNFQNLYFNIYIIEVKI